ncbi:MAG: BMP family ABC transporter substrate-binding protein [Actinobacteria bacterium]|nr:BMP family ABC transporter substrate-binding protein [Actinomycetota bacterium]
MKKIRGVLAIIAILAITISSSSFASASQPELHIGVAYDTGGLGDHSLNDAVNSGFLSAKKSINFSLESTVTIGSESDRQARVLSLVKKRCDLILVVGSQYASALKVLAAQFPDQKFVIINDETVGLRNVTSLVFAENQGGYLAGVTAALLSQSSKIGIITHLSQSKDFDKGFALGAQAVKKGILINSKYANDSTANVAKQMIADGVDIIFSTNPGSDVEVLNVVANANKNGKSVGLIGLEPEQYATLSATTKKYLIASVVKRLDIAVVDLLSEMSIGYTLSDIVNPALGVSGRRYGITDKGVEISLWSSKSIKLKKQINNFAKKAAKLST